MRGYSPNTISSYRDAFKLLICYFRDEQGIPPEKLTLDLIDATTVTAFIGWLQDQPAQQPVDSQPAPRGDRLVLLLDANPGSGEDGVLPRHPADPRHPSTTSPRSST